MLCGGLLPCHAQSVTDSIRGNLYPLYFSHDKAVLDAGYLKNAQHMDTLRSGLEKASRIDSIAIYSYSSPEGTRSFLPGTLSAESAEAEVLQVLNGNGEAPI